ncbi:MAG: pirin family protein [Planctomycetes bacterium]|nr:pirin family protein [Planctomycetota bacterium]
MIAIRRAEERGHFGQGWIDAYHTFSFERYRDPEHTGFRQLVALNDERVEPGFEWAHAAPRDVEILSYVLEGDLAPETGSGETTPLRRGAFRRQLSRGGEHRIGAQSASSLRLLEFWLRPERATRTSGVEHVHVSDDEKRGKLKLVASPDGRDGSLSVGNDARIYVSLLGEGESVEHAIASGRHAWVQVARGSLELNGRILTAGDGAAASAEARVAIKARSDAEFVLIDLA